MVYHDFEMYKMNVKCSCTTDGGSDIWASVYNGISYLYILMVSLYIQYMEYNSKATCNIFMSMDSAKIERVTKGGSVFSKCFSVLPRL